MDQVPLATSSTIIPVNRFWSSVLVYHDRPYLINRKLGTVVQVLFCEVSLTHNSTKRMSDIFTREALLYEIRRLPNLKSVSPQFIKNIIETYDREVLITESNKCTFQERFEGVFISIRELYGRKEKIKCLEVVILDRKNQIATFFAVQEHDDPILAPRYPYHIELSKTGNLRIILNSFEDADTNSAGWLAIKLFPKLIKWSESEVDINSVIHSLNLVEADDYYNTYIDLKDKYSKQLIEMWPQNARTDPLKYVYEDLAIATYLICLWRKLGFKEVNFVDCGCGNGLLVHVLNQEGYNGCGLDIRSRKLWKQFTEELKVEAVTPTSVFPNATWIIGNHSDELTPWIPIIATKSSRKTNFFVLPCCTYDFSGRKYIRKDTSKSQYNEYLNYIKTISTMCGFQTSMDRLKIPSTRRTCLVGIRDNCDANFEKIIYKMEKFVNSKFDGKNYVPREPVEQVRNCTKLDKNVINKIVHTTVNALLSKREFIDTKPDGERWNRGGPLSLSELSQILKDDLQELKNEYGGLQTLLKNCRYIFQVQRGIVFLQKPLSLAESTKYKEKPCWFSNNHPDGCFYNNETCAYKH